MKNTIAVNSIEYNQKCMPTESNRGWQGKEPSVHPDGFFPDRTPDKFFRHTFLLLP